MWPVPACIAFSLLRFFEVLFYFFSYLKNPKLTLENWIIYKIEKWKVKEHYIFAT